MKSRKLGWGVFVLLLTANFVACKGKDPGGNNFTNLRAEADQKYTGVTPPVVQPPTPPPAPDNSQTVCFEPFKVSVTPDSGSNLLKFTENTQGTFTINVRSFMGSDFVVATENLSPELSSDFAAGRATLKQTSKDASTATYTLTWKPGKLNFTTSDIQTLTLRYTSSAARVCGGDINTELNLLVVPQSQTPGASQ